MANKAFIDGIEYEIESYMDFPDGSVSATLIPIKGKKT